MQMQGEIKLPNGAWHDSCQALSLRAMTRNALATKVELDGVTKFSFSRSLRRAS